MCNNKISRENRCASQRELTRIVIVMHLSICAAKRVQSSEFVFAVRYHSAHRRCIRTRQNLGVYQHEIEWSIYYFQFNSTLKLLELCQIERVLNLEEIFKRTRKCLV